MPQKPYKMMEAYDGVEIPVPLGLTPEEEAAVIEKFRAENPPEKIAEEEAMLRAALDGTDPAATTLEQLLKELEADLRPGEKSA